VPGVEAYRELRLKALACACGVVGREERWKMLMAEGRVVDSASVTEMEGVLGRKVIWKLREDGVL
jgi:hypothetical protein